MLQRLEPVHVVGILGRERIEHRLVLARRVKASLDAELVHQPREAEGTADDPDGTDDRGRIADDLVAGAGDHVAARGRHVLGEDDDRTLVLLRERTDAAIDEMGLHGRAARRIDHQRHRLGAPHAKGAIERLRDGREREGARPQRAREPDNAGEAHHRHDRDVAAQPFRQHRPQRLVGAR